MLVAWWIEEVGEGPYHAFRNLWTEPAQVDKCLMETWNQGSNRASLLRKPPGPGGLFALSCSVVFSLQARARCDSKLDVLPTVLNNVWQKRIHQRIKNVSVRKDARRAAPRTAKGLGQSARILSKSESQCPFRTRVECSPLDIYPIELHRSTPYILCEASKGRNIAGDCLSICLSFRFSKRDSIRDGIDRVLTVPELCTLFNALNY